MKTTPIQDLAIIDVKWWNERVEDWKASIVMLQGKGYEQTLLGKLELLIAIDKNIKEHLYSLEEARSDAIDEFAASGALTTIDKDNCFKRKQEYLSQPITLKPL